MTKEILEQYLDVKKEIDKLEDRIKKMEKQGPLIADTVQVGIEGKKRRIGVVRGIEKNWSKRLERNKTNLQIFKLKLNEQQGDVENYINEIKKPAVRQIFEHRYLEAMEWYQIALEMGYSGESTPRMRHDRYLEKNI